MDSCPGRRSVSVSSVEVICPDCGAHLEMFSDEVKARCRCGKTILREALPSCAMWCPAAKRCLGEVIDLRQVLERVESARRESECDDYVKEIATKIRHARGREGGSGGEEAGHDG
jgi:hypothetical protein